MDLWKWDEASPQGVSLGNRLSRLEGAELGFCFPEVALQEDTLTEETCWKATSLPLAGLPQQDWSSASPHPETPWGAEHASQALWWSDGPQRGRTGWDAWSRVSPAPGPAPCAGSPGLAGPRSAASAACAGGTRPRRRPLFREGPWGRGLPRLLGLGAARGPHRLSRGVPGFRSHHLLRTRNAAAGGPRNAGLLSQNEPPR
uniref:ETS variant transcription factor 2 n=1 Tax=Pipistrellus kuhlii TaxID=59472 RepID=A0A7J7V041_PIPKU|nr:ETS variant transcription factor 2 [Pipistrellus kuhlii]